MENFGKSKVPCVQEFQISRQETACVQICQVTKRFGEDLVLKEVNLTLNYGQVYGIVGNNGSGKTVLMKCICGFLPTTTGTIHVFGKQIGRDVDFPESLGVIIETPGFLTQYTGAQNLEILASMRGQITKADIRLVLRRVGLDPDMKKPVGKYSLGMRQRLGIAQAIMEDPRFLILDEPFNGLDKHGVAEIRELLLELKAAGKTILLASHNEEDIRILCDHVYEMDGGILKERTKFHPNPSFHKKLRQPFLIGACLFLSIFLLPVSAVASEADGESTFVSTDSDNQPPAQEDTSSDLDGFFSGDDTSDSTNDKTIHVIIENGDSSAITDPGTDSTAISEDGYTDNGSEGYAGGNSGSTSSGEVILHKPQILLEDSNLSGQSLNAGTTQEMSVTFRNKSRSQNVFGLKVSLSTETKGIEFAQNSFYVQRLTPGEAITLKQLMIIAPNTDPGQVTVTFSMEYEDSKANAATGSETLTFNISQQLRAELEVTDIPSAIYTMDTIEVPVKAMNLGRDKLYNAKVSLEADGLSPSGTVFLGNIDAGAEAEGSMKIYVKGTKELSQGQISGRFLLTYEDSSGNSYETASDFQTELKETQIQSLKVEEDQTQTNSWWYSILAVAALFLICIILLLLVSLRRKSILLEEARKAASH